MMGILAEDSIVVGFGLPDFADFFDDGDVGLFGIVVAFHFGYAQTKFSKEVHCTKQRCPHHIAVHGRDAFAVLVPKILF